MNEKPNTCLKKFGLQVSISYFFHSPDTLVAAQARNLVHEKKYLINKIWLFRFAKTLRKHGSDRT